ncbi:MAG: putative ATPase [Myxococcota bacterium]|jgi:predicted ATPase
MIGLDIALGFAVSAAQGALSNQTIASAMGALTGSTLAPSLDSLFSAEQKELRVAVESADLWLAARPPSPVRDVLAAIEPSTLPELCQATSRLPSDLDGSMLRGAILDAFSHTPAPGPVREEAASIFYEALLRALVVVPAVQGRAQALLTEWLLQRSLRVVPVPAVQPEETPTNLAPSTTPLVGRSEDLSRLRVLLQDHRLVTVIGTAGTGKTRLVRALGWNRRADWDSVWFCDLADARTEAGIFLAVARGMNIPLGAGNTLQQLGRAINGWGRCLILFDNFEQLVALAPGTLGKWLEMAPAATFVVTSRARLHLHGEVLLSVEPLPLTAAVQLFEQRAAALKRGFRVDASNYTVISDIVTTLDGLPLAIELAAARIRVLSVVKLRARLSDRFRLLRSKGALSRQATLRAALEWSWELLQPEEQSALAQLSTFVGGFTLEAAEEVLDLDAWPDAWAMDTVEALIDRSLVRTVTDERFNLLMSVAAFASEKLKLMGMHDESVLRHGAWFSSAEMDIASARLDLENLIATVQRALARGDTEVALGALGPAMQTLHETGPFSTALELSTAVAGMTGLSPKQTATLNYLRGDNAQYRGDPASALLFLRAALTGAIAAGDRRGEIRTRAIIGYPMFMTGEAEAALEVAEQALTMAQVAGDAESVAVSANILGILTSQSSGPRTSDFYQIALDSEQDTTRQASTLINWAEWDRHQGNLESSLARLEQAESLLGTDAMSPFLAQVVGVRGNIMVRLGRHQEGRDLLDEATQYNTRIGNQMGTAAYQVSRSMADFTLGNVEQAVDGIERSILFYREVGNQRYLSSSLRNLGGIMQASGDASRARVLGEESLAIARQFNLPIGAAFALILLAELEGCGGDASVARGYLHEATELLEGGQFMEQKCQAMMARSLVEHHAGEADAARRAFAEAETRAATMGIHSESRLGLRMAGLRNLLERS